ncbi:MAG: hypothetical protein ACKOAS_09185 [Verrucomicrobiota bacterium]
MTFIIFLAAIAVLAAGVFVLWAIPSRMRLVMEVGLLIALAVVSFLYFDLFVSEGYTRSSLRETQNEARDLAGLLRPELTPGKLEALAKDRKIPFERLKGFLHANIPSGCSAYSCGKLTFFFDANDQLVDVRGHLLDQSLLHSDELNEPKP